MKKSGFEDSEIREYRERKMKGNNETEKEALAKMEVAVEKIMMEVSEIKKIMKSSESPEQKILALKKHIINKENYSKLIKALKYE
jgi:hypothetical protein